MCVQHKKLGYPFLTGRYASTSFKLSRLFWRLFEGPPKREGGSVSVLHICHGSMTTVPVVGGLKRFPSY